MDRIEYQRRVAHNTALMQQGCLELSRYYLWDAEPGEADPFTLGDKFHDMAAAAAIGALAVLSRTGCDAMLLRGARFQEIELKFCKINSSRYAVGPQGGIFMAGRRYRTSFDATVQAQWTINSDTHLRTKQRLTVLVVYDTHHRRFVEARAINGRTVMEHLQRQRGARRFMFWNHFEQQGRRLTLVVPALGMNNLKESIRSQHGS